MSELEQNKYINQLRGQLTHAVERIKTLELNLEPDGRISEAFSVMEEHIDTRFDWVHARFDRLESRLDRMEHQFIAGLNGWRTQSKDYPPQPPLERGEIPRAYS